MLAEERRQHYRMNVTPYDLLVLDTDHGWLNMTAHHALGTGIVHEVVRTALGESEGQGNRVQTAAGAARALYIIGGFGRHIAHNDGLQVSHVNAKLESRRATQNIDSALDE